MSRQTVCADLVLWGAHVASATAIRHVTGIHSPNMTTAHESCIGALCLEHFWGMTTQGQRREVRDWRSSCVECEPTRMRLLALFWQRRCAKSHGFQLPCGHARSAWQQIELCFGTGMGDPRTLYSELVARWVQSDDLHFRRPLPSGSLYSSATYIDGS